MIGQELSALGVKYSRLTSQGGLDILLQFQFRCYTKQDPPPILVNPIPLQFLCYIASVAAASYNPVLQAEFRMIITAYLFSFHPSKYTGSKSKGTPFHIEYIAFSCGHRVFTVTAT